MKNLTKILAATLTGAVLALAAPSAFADGRGHDREYRYYDNRDWGHEHRRHHYRHHYRGPAVVYGAPYYAPAPAYYGPPPVVYQPNYYVPRPAPAVTIGISPIVIPFR